VVPRWDLRPAGPSDGGAVAALHADSWRRHYRGAYSDSFLDGDVATDRLNVWTERLSRADAGSWTLLAEDADGIIGFAHVVFDDDPTWGSLLDNIHVARAHQRRGVGSDLLTRAARVVADRSNSAGFYLWVLEQNAGAQAFYSASGARRVERVEVGPPGGVPGRLNGSPYKLRYAWDSPDAFVLRWAATRHARDPKALRTLGRARLQWLGSGANEGTQSGCPRNPSADRGPQLH
jgi:ribosomal protein S18 acetylase RimI-like enzyme